MLKDIEILKVEDLVLAVVPPEGGETSGQEEFWDSFIINLKNEPIHSVLVCSSGYGEVEGEQRRTSSMRYFWETIGPLQAESIEPIQRILFGMINEFWVSFSYNEYMYDKKYIFVPGSLDAQYLTDIPLLNRKGVMIR